MKKRQWVAPLLAAALLSISLGAKAYFCPSEKSVLFAIKKANAEKYTPFVKFFNQDLPWLINLSTGVVSQNQAKNFRFFQIKRINDRLYCFYQWPSQTGMPDNYLSVGLVTTRTIIPTWQDNPYACQSFHLKHCAFRFSQNYW